MKKDRPLSQQLLWSAMAVMVGAVFAAIFFTNITLRSIEKNLPNKLMTELNQLSIVLDDLSEVVSAVQIAQNKPDASNLTLLREKVAVVNEGVVALRNSYVFDNLIQASAFHAVVAPAIIDLQTWLSDGVSGYGPESETVLAIVFSRISVTFKMARKVNRESKTRAQAILEKQRDRLDRFLFSVNLFFLLTIAITFSMVFLLIRQHRFQRREDAAQIELRNQRDLVNSLFERILMGIMVWDREGTLLHANKGFTEITGYLREEIKTLADWLHKAYPDPEYRRRVWADWDSSTDRENTVYELKVTCKGGAVKDIEYRGAFLPDGRALITLSDITDRKRAEKALQESREIKARSRKMESLGLLAGGVAHDLNNILSGIINYPELLLLDLPKDSKLRKPIEAIQASGNRAAAIVMDLLTVARGVASPKEPLNLNNLIREYLESPEFENLKLIHPSITVTTNLGAGLLNIDGSPVHIRKVVMNLVLNASEAIKGRGNITISTANRHIERPLRNYNDVKAGGYTLLSVSDEGSGISPEDLERIFEPFYTKKTIGLSGTGLGLAVVWNVVQDHEGYINVESNDNGTIFELYFPITGKELPGRDLAGPIVRYRGAGESILVVDDMESQREIVCEMLKALGYKAESVPSGEAAVAYLKEHKPDLMLLDMIMSPGINGRETYERALKIHPNQKALITSGFAETSEVKAAQALGAGRYLRKPFTLESIGNAIQEELKR